MYGGYAWMTNAVSAHTTNRRLPLLGGMGGYFVLALTAATALALATVPLDATVSPAAQIGALVVLLVLAIVLEKGWT